jgi:hypothetical protein
MKSINQLQIRIIKINQINQSSNRAIFNNFRGCWPLPTTITTC